MSDDTNDGASQRNNPFNNPSRRAFVKSVGAGLGGALLGVTGLSGCGGASPNQGSAGGAQADNLIIRENSRSGDSGWEPANVTPTRNIEGYTTRDSVNPDDPLEFCVSSASSSYTIDIYRLGWYDGVGARKVHSISGSNGSQQSVPEPEGSEMLITCDWPVTDSVTVPSEWTTGLYYAIFRSGGEATACPFVVREEIPSARMLVQLPFHTQQAYNNWGGYSFYDFNSDDDEYHDLASYNRPYANAYAMHLGYAIHFIRWAEREGYSMAYATNLDMMRYPDTLQEYTLVTCVGHDEYPPPAQYDAYKNARDTGTNLMFLGGNLWTTQTPFRENDRVIVKKGGWEEARITGLEFAGTSLWKLADLKVVDPSHRWFEGTGFEKGEEVVGVVGHEWDKLVEESPDNARRLFRYEKGTQENPISNDDDADSIVYEAESGATVFNCGVLGWPYRLDPDNEWGQGKWPLSRLKDHKPEVTKPDPKLQAFQKNVTDELITAS